jgi:hypothetical protein
VNCAPPTLSPPTANAGLDQTVASGATVTLDGSGSADAEGPITGWRWLQTDGPPVVLDLTDPARPSFLAPRVAAATALAGVGALVAAGNSALSGLTDLVIVAAARGAALERRLADHTAFPLGGWPRSTTLAPADASGSAGEGAEGRRSVPGGPDTATDGGGSVGP